MKLRKNEMISPKSFFFLRWRIKNIHVRNWSFLTWISKGGCLVSGLPDEI